MDEIQEISNASKLLSMEVVILGIVLTAIFIIGLIILFRVIKFDKFKLGKLEISKSPQDKARDEKQDSEISQILEISKSMGARLDMVDNHLKVVDSRLDAQYAYVRKAVTTAGTAVAWSDKGAPFEETIQAILTNIALGQNSNLDDRLKEVVFGRVTGVKDFNSQYNRFVNSEENKSLLAGNEQFFERCKYITRGWGSK